MTLALSTIVGAQTLELPTRLPPPALDGDTYAARVVEDLEREIDELARAERSLPPDGRGFARAAINLRLLAVQLLHGHEAAGPRQHARALAGLRLAHDRSELDGMLDAAARQDPFAVAAALDALRHFNDAVVDHASALREATVSDLDVILPRVIAPLARAGSGVLGGAPVDHWPRGPTDRAAPAAAAEDPAVALDDLARRCAGIPMPDAVRTHVEVTLDHVRRAARYPDLRPDADRFLRLLDDVLAFASTVADAAWMGEGQAASYLAELEDVARALRTPAARDRGERRLRRLGISRAVIGRITKLGAGAEDTRVLAAALAEADSFAVAESGADAASADVALPEFLDQPEAPPALRRLVGVVDHMISFRALETTEVPPDLRSALGKLKRAYRTSERAVLRQLDALADDAALADPALLSVIANHAQYAEDLERLRRLPDVIEAMAEMNDDATTRVRARIRRTCGRLTDPGRRPDAVRTLDDLEARVAAIAPLAFEAALRRGARSAVVAAGGRHLELLDAIADARRAWVVAWADDDEPESAAARRLDLLARLVRLMSDSADALDADGEGLVIERWAGWEMPRGVVRRAGSDLPNRLKLATVSAIAGDDAELADQLDRIEREVPLVRLVGAIVHVLGDDLAALPDGPRGRLGRLVYPPRSDARLLDQRLRIAELCRYASEAAFAWDAGSAERAAELQRYVNALAEEIGATIG